MTKLTPKKKNRKIVSIKAAYEASRCRRGRERTEISPTAITCWSREQRPVEVSAIEVDTHGARFLLPWYATPGEPIKVALADELGQYRTIQARVVWTQHLHNSGRVIAGICFREEVREHQLAA